ncbi:hypothetical protein BaRGS_00002804 [Batillaria attramentaria]|uniref:Uncharacterized protein n=1 Tax=Batillaria attramentaria TaxID=370345 RepID=A0ABD0M4C5_9CAEN
MKLRTHTGRLMDPDFGLLYPVCFQFQASPASTNSPAGFRTPITEFKIQCFSLRECRPHISLKTDTQRHQLFFGKCDKLKARLVKHPAVGSAAAAAPAEPRKLKAFLFARLTLEQIKMGLG